MDSRLRTIRSNPETEFGGVNVILCGDSEVDDELWRNIRAI
jgi:hypothetical protein